MPHSTKNPPYPIVIVGIDCPATVNCSVMNNPW